MSVKIEEYIKSLPNDIISGNEVQLPDDSLRKVFEFLNLDENDIFYHLGCGDGEGIKIALQEFHVKNAIGVDNNKEKIQRAIKLITKNHLDGDPWIKGCQNALHKIMRWRSLRNEDFDGDPYIKEVLIEILI